MPKKRNDSKKGTTAVVAQCTSKDCTPSTDSKFTWCSVCPKTLAASSRPKYCDGCILWCANGDGAKGAYCTARACPSHHESFYVCTLQLSKTCQPDASRVSGQRRWCRGCYHWSSTHDTLLRCKCGASRACKPYGHHHIICHMTRVQELLDIVIGVKKVAPSHSRDTPWECSQCSTTSDDAVVRGTGHNQADDSKTKKKKMPPKRKLATPPPPSAADDSNDSSDDGDNDEKKSRSKPKSKARTKKARTSSTTTTADDSTSSSDNDNNNDSNDDGDDDDDKPKKAKASSSKKKTSKKSSARATRSTRATASK